MAGIQRNALVAPFSVRDDLMHVNERGKPTGKLAVTHQKWFTEAEQAINGSLQLSANVPAASTSPGEAGTIVPFAGGFYFCVGSGNWLKFVGAPF